MATIQINTNTTYDSYFWVSWEQQSQDIGANKTTIAWSCGVYCGHSFYLNAIKMSAFSINGVQVYGGGTYSNFSKGEHQIAWGTLAIPHNADGKKSFSISSFTGWLYSNYNYSSNGGSYDLPNIPRQATLTAAPNFTDLQNPTITYSNPAGNAVTALEACISFTGERDDIAYRPISMTGSSYPFPLSPAEREVLRRNTPGPNRTVIFFVRTKIGNNTYHSTLQRTLTIAESEATKPTVSMTLSPVNSLSAPFKDLYIQGKSKVKASLTMSAKTGANIVASSLKVEESYYASPYESAVLTKDGNQTIYGDVKDSRGYYGHATSVITVIPYSKPTVESADCYRSDGNGKKVRNSTSIWLKAKRSYSTVNGKNTCGMRCRWKLATESWNDTTHPWNWLIEGQNTATDWYDALLPGEFTQTKAYTVQVQVIDDIGESHTRTFNIPTEDVALHLGDGGKNVSIGSYCDYSQEHTFHSAWDATFDKSINGVYVKTVNVMGGKVIRLQTAYSNWIPNGTSRQSFLVFGSSNGALVHGVCIVHNTGFIQNSDITNCVAECEDGNGVVKLTLVYDTWDVITILSTRSFTILQE